MSNVPLIAETVLLSQGLWFLWLLSPATSWTVMSPLSPEPGLTGDPQGTWRGRCHVLETSYLFLPLAHSRAEGPVDVRGWKSPL